MKITQTIIKDLLIIEPRVFGDERGYFFESFSQQKFIENNLDYNFIQDNQSFSSYGTIRGLHFQKGKHAQAKLVRVITGKVLDVAVDLRPNSKTFGQHFNLILSGENSKQLLIPRGFAHGFSVLSDTAIFSYKCDNYYNKESEGGLLFSDQDLKIDWQIPLTKALVSDKDKILPALKDLAL